MSLLIDRRAFVRRPLACYRPTKFELVVNVKTAKALGLAMPQALLARADRLIQ